MKIRKPFGYFALLLVILGVSLSSASAGSRERHERRHRLPRVLYFIRVIPTSDHSFSLQAGVRVVRKTMEVDQRMGLMNPLLDLDSLNSFPSQGRPFKMKFGGMKTREIHFSQEDVPIPAELSLEVDAAKGGLEVFEAKLKKALLASVATYRLDSQFWGGGESPAMGNDVINPLAGSLFIGESTVRKLQLQKEEFLQNSGTPESQKVGMKIQKTVDQTVEELLIYWANMSKFSRRALRPTTKFCIFLCQLC